MLTLVQGRGNVVFTLLTVISKNTTACAHWVIPPLTPKFSLEHSAYTKFEHRGLSKKQSFFAEPQSRQAVIKVVAKGSN
ncbi:hypothetical protein SSYM_1720 [Serratia symbiotica str. Tucson]|uniref:Uncharacterized protein n=1 Tax=Serratia symbiotica str. Tucson TaxID=914128 RepID=E9CN16_9GAMM|nr:hypothetical protein SSYM_1720 [Serratia symbiotica str. Tucson]CDS58482.1 conserved hypothetical protein [Serratia symbiotica]